MILYNWHNFLIYIYQTSIFSVRQYLYLFDWNVCLALSECLYKFRVRASTNPEWYQPSYPTLKNIFFSSVQILALTPDVHRGQGEEGGYQTHQVKVQQTSQESNQSSYPELKNTSLSSVQVFAIPPDWHGGQGDEDGHQTHPGPNVMKLFTSVIYKCS